MDDDDDFEFDGEHSCDKCDMSFKNAESLKRHIKTHFIKSEVMSDDEGPVKTEPTNLGCNVCGESFTEALDLLAHAEIHARFQPFKCLLCGETFFEENKIKMHLKYKKYLIISMIKVFFYIACLNLVKIGFSKPKN